MVKKPLKTEDILIGLKGVLFFPVSRRFFRCPFMVHMLPVVGAVGVWG